MWAAIMLGKEEMKAAADAISQASIICFLTYMTLNIQKVISQIFIPQFIKVIGSICLPKLMKRNVRIESI
jgi:hypothetical protein